MQTLRYFIVALVVADFVLLLVRPRLGFLGLILLLPFVNRFIPRLGPGLNGETFLFAGALVGLMLQARPPLPQLRVIAPFAFYYAVALFSLGLLVTWPEFERQGGNLVLFAQSLKAVLWPTLLFFIAYALAPSRSSRRVALLCLVVAVLCFAFSGLLDFRSGSAAASSERYRAAGVLADNPNILGAALAVTSLVPLVVMLDRTRAMSARVFAGGVYAVAIFVILLTQSRGAWLALLTGHGVWLFLTNRKLVVPAAALGMAVIVLGYTASLLPAIISDRIQTTLTPGRSVYQSGSLAGRFEPSVDVRLAYHMMGAEMFMASPLYGHGHGSFKLLTREYGLKYGVWRNRTRSTSSESMFVKVAVDFGLLGIAGSLWMSWMLLARALALRRRGGEEATLAALFISAFFAVVAVSATQNALQVHEVSLPFWLLAGLTVRAFYDRTPDSEPAAAAQLSYRWQSAGQAAHLGEPV